MYPHNLAILFYEVLEKCKDRDCLTYEEISYTYDDMNNYSKKFAKYLIDLNLKKGDVIAIASDKNPETFFLMLAAIRLGVAYVNIDIESPLERNLLILKKCQIKYLFYDCIEYSEYIDLLSKKISFDNFVSSIKLDQNDLKELKENDEQVILNKSIEVDGNNISYIMFTSGSTGEPKGVAVSHQNLLHFIEWGINLNSSSGQLNYTNINPLYFDNSVFDFYVSIFSGSRLTPIKRKLLQEPYKLLEYIDKMKCNIWFSVPSLLIYLVAMKAFSRTKLPFLKKIIFGGEGYPKSELKKLYQIFNSHAELVNVYGPTECTCICSAHTITNKDLVSLEGLPTLGKLNQNINYILLDHNGKPSENEGELCLIGPNVALGYFNDLELTNKSFTFLSDSKLFMNRMYNTGDLVRFHKGYFYFTGRKDNQIKHMGYRIELEEIEEALNSLDDVIQSAVIYKREKVAYGKIICFLQSSNDNEETIKLKISEKLPSYMIPSTYVFMENLPKNANGKVDRNKLKQLK